MVYLDSLFQGVGAAKSFERLCNFIECAAKLRGKAYCKEEWEFYVIPPSDIPQQYNSVDCGVFVVKWAQHISEGRVIDFDQDNIDNFRYSLILDIARNKLSRLTVPSTEINTVHDDIQQRHCNSDNSAPTLDVTMTHNKTSSFEDHSYTSFGQTRVFEKATKDVLPQNVQNILPSSFSYKYLEYKELPNSNTNGPIQIHVTSE